MRKKRKIAGSEVDPTLPRIEIEIDGKTYRLCFDLAALAEAKAHFAKAGHKINVLQALSELDVDNLRVLFPCALHKFHPEIGFEEAQKLITYRTMFEMSGAVLATWAACMPKRQETEGKPQDPPKP